MSNLTDEQVRVLNEWARTQPSLRRVFPYTQGSGVDTQGLGTALDSGGAGLSSIEVRESDGNPPEFDTDTLIFDSEAFYLHPNSTGKPTVSFRPSAVGSVGVTDHGALTGLGDDDHPQYRREDATESITAEAFYLASGGELRALNFNSDHFYLSTNLTGEAVVNLRHEYVAKHLTLQSPARRDTITWFRAVESEFRVSELHSFLRTRDSGFYPFVEFTIRFGNAIPSRGSGTELTPGGWLIGFYPNHPYLTENPLVRTEVTNPVIPYNNWVWLETVDLGEGNSVEEELHVTLKLRKN